jgi:transposase
MEGARHLAVALQFAHVPDIDQHHVVTPGQAERRTPDYARNGTTSLFAALNVATGEVIGKCYRRHRQQEFLKFLKKIDQQTLPYLDLHLIVDNYATHKTPAVQRWLKRHQRFKLHFIPTSSSWLNLVERLFAEITRQQIRRGVFHSVPELEAAIVEWINHRNANPKPFVWTATARSITLKRNRAKKGLANLARDANE